MFHTQSVSLCVRLEAFYICVWAHSSLYHPMSVCVSGCVNKQSGRVGLRRWRGGGVTPYFGWGNPSFVLDFFICISSLKTHWACGVKLSLPGPFLTGQRDRERESTATLRGLVLGVWVGVHKEEFVGGKGVTDHGKNTIPGPSIALVPPHFTRTPTLCVPLVTDPLLIPPNLWACLSPQAADVCQPPPSDPSSSSWDLWTSTL